MMHIYWLIAGVILILLILTIFYYYSYYYTKNTKELFVVLSGEQQQPLEIPTAYAYLLLKKKWPVDKQLDNNEKMILYMMRTVVIERYIDTRSIWMFADAIKLPEESMNIFGITKKSKDSVMTIENSSGSIEVAIKNNEIYIDCSKYSFKDIKLLLQILYKINNNYGNEYDENLSDKLKYIGEQTVLLNKSTASVENEIKINQAIFDKLSKEIDEFKKLPKADLCY
jgi:hypothetical protein